jgi:hypothetical protein
LAANDARLEALLGSGRVRAQCGLSALLDSIDARESVGQVDMRHPD